MTFILGCRISESRLYDPIDIGGGGGRILDPLVKEPPFNQQ